MQYRPIRLLVIAICIGFSAWVGFLIRWARWILRCRPRVTHGICPLHSLKDTVLADRSAGILARSVVLYARQTDAYDYTTEADFDVVFSRSQHESTEKYWQCLCHILISTDIWSTSFRPFLPGRHETANRIILWMMKATGIRIVAFPYGTDVAWRDRHRDRFDWVGRMQRDYPDWDLEAWGDSARANVRVLSKYADLVIGMDGSLRRFLPRNDIYCKPIPVDTRFLTPLGHRFNGGTPVIVHAQNHRNVKGTQFLLDSLEQLRELGIRFELRVIERMRRADAITAYRQADIIADQFVMGAYGVFALEGLALGKPVLTYLDHDHLSDPVFNLPIVNTNRDNLTAVLGVLLQVPELCIRLGEAGRAAVVKYHSPEAIGELNKAIYDHLWWGAPLELGKTAHFDRRTTRAFTENPSEEEFWPVAVDDLGEKIRVALEKLQPDYLQSASPNSEAKFAESWPHGLSRQVDSKS